MANFFLKRGAVSVWNPIDFSAASEKGTDRFKMDV